jgi:hypothetical protein
MSNTINHHRAANHAAWTGPETCPVCAAINAIKLAIIARDEVVALSLIDAMAPLMNRPDIDAMDVWLEMHPEETHREIMTAIRHRSDLM